MNNLTPNQYTLNRPRSKKWQYLLFSLILVLIAVVFWGLVHLRSIRDWYILATYTPPASVQQLAQTDQMTTYAKNLFYVNKPDVESKQSFALSCPNNSEQAYILGCYHSGDNGIYLLNVTEPDLNGIIPVTAAYEMLHAGYARLSNTERSYLDNLMWSFYTSDVTSSEIKSQMAVYAQSEPGERYDELYSVLATEVANLPPALANHYKLYFADRSKIVAMYDNYQAAFTTKLDNIATDDAELNQLKAQIDSNESSINTTLASLNSQRQSLNQEASSLNYQEYNSQVAAFNAQVNNYNSLVSQTSSEINSYNALVNSRNSLALEEQHLVQAISSKPVLESTK